MKNLDNGPVGLKVCAENLQIKFGDFVALKHTTLEVRPKEFFTLLGPSGCGKTTLLRCIAGFVKQADGCITFDGKDISDIEPWNRGIGFVFQNYALWPTKTVFKNVSYGLEMRRESKREIRRKVAETLELVELSDVAELYPGELSGGMQQRVALARAIVIDPPLLLFDEPLSNLDAKLRVKLRRDIKELQSRLGLTTIYVTHDQEEALEISDRIAVMRQGEIMQVGTPRDIYANPVNAHVADFIGKATFMRGRALSDCEFQLEDGTRISAKLNPQTTLENAVNAFVRPETINIVEKDKADIVGAVVEESFLGNLTRYWLEMKNGQRLMIETNKTMKVGDSIGVKFPSLALFDETPKGQPTDEEFQ